MHASSTVMYVPSIRNIRNTNCNYLLSLKRSVKYGNKKVFVECFAFQEQSNHILRAIFSNIFIVQNPSYNTYFDLFGKKGNQMYRNVRQSPHFFLRGSFFLVNISYRRVQQGIFFVPSIRLFAFSFSFDQSFADPPFCYV